MDPNQVELRLHAVRALGRLRRYTLYVVNRDRIRTGNWVLGPTLDRQGGPLVTTKFTERQIRRMARAYSRKNGPVYIRIGNARSDDMHYVRGRDVYRMSFWDRLFRR